MGVGDLSFAAIHSLKAIDDWIATINANMGGTARVGYKASRVTFTGGTALIARNAAGGALPIQIPEQSLSNAGTSIDFSQGAIVASTEKTHFAIQGKGFYVLRDDSDSDGVPDGGTYYSRDGEFHLDSGNRLRNSLGLLLVSAASTGAAVTVTNIDILDPNSTTGLQGGPIAIRQINNESDLQFSKYGSTIFLQGTATLGGTASNLTITQSLEASNASLTQLVPELSLAQKMFSAISKVLQVNYQNIDTILNLIR